MVKSKYIIIAKTLRNTLGLKSSDRVLIITDSGMEKIARTFEFVSKSISKETFFLKIKKTERHGKEPPKKAAEIMKNFDVVMGLTTFSLTHTKAFINAHNNGIRIASLPGFNEKMFEALNIDYGRLEKECLKLKRILESSSGVRLTTPDGTDISFSIKGCKITIDSGNPKNIINLPAGEVFLPPKKTRGRLVVGVDKKRAEIIIEKNRAKKIQKSNKLKKMLSVPGGRNVAEFGIGMNEKAKIIGNILMDEKVLGTCHIAFGNNIGFGGSVRSSIHQDFVLFKPTVEIDGKIIMKHGVPEW
ncbi:MAG: aminopeptidase [Bacteroidetes bacterium]|nr:MAG: aminopeptidase [Bacteroidota bacterium]